VLALVVLYVQRRRPSKSGGPGEAQWTRRLVAAVAVCAVVVSLVGGALGWATSEVACSGDGGQPYAAPASAYGRYCDAQGYSLAFVLPALPVLLGGALVARRRRWVFLAVGVVIAAALATSPLLAAWALPDKCGEEASHPAWRSADPGDPEQLRPECQHY
jgi:hypothetical protein